MKIYNYKNGNQAYPNILKDILENGDLVSPRGLQTREVYPAITVLEKPSERFLTTYGRNINPFFLVAEAIWILAGKGDRDFIEYYNRELAKFSDENFPDFNGAYGVRMRKWGQDREGNNLQQDISFDQLEDVYMKLKEDKDTRQAVITFHNPVFDRSEVKTNDRPCNVVSLFKIRNNKLHLHQIIRSNDINLGLFPTNYFQFSMIQEVLAGWLEVEVGEILFFSDSLHCYLGEAINLGIPDRVLKYEKIFDIYDIIIPTDARVSKEYFDLVLDCILKNQKMYRNGIFDKDLEIQHDFWYSVNQVLKVWSLRKYNKRVKAIYETEKIKSQDFKISLLEYQYRNSKTQQEKDDIKFIITHYDKEIQNFITGEYNE